MASEKESVTVLLEEIARLRTKLDEMEVQVVRANHREAGLRKATEQLITESTAFADKVVGGFQSHFKLKQCIEDVRTQLYSVPNAIEDLQKMIKDAQNDKS